MAINPSDRWPSRTEAPDADYPYGGAKDETSPDAFDGTPFERSLLNDTWGFYQALLSQAGITPSGNPDTAQASQYLEALVAVVRGGLNVQTAVVELGGGFNPGARAVFQRVGAEVTVHFINASHAVGPTTSSSPGIIPQAFRATPGTAPQAMKSFGNGARIAVVSVSTASNSFDVSHRDWETGSLTSGDNITGATMTYLVTGDVEGV